MRTLFCFLLLAGSASASTIELMAFDFTASAKGAAPRNDVNPDGMIPAYAYFNCAFPSNCSLAEVRVDATAAHIGTTFLATESTVAAIDTALHSPKPIAGFGYIPGGAAYWEEVQFNDAPTIWTNEWNAQHRNGALAIQAHVPSFDGYRISGVSLTVNEFQDVFDGGGGEIFRLAYTVRLHGVAIVPEPASLLLLCLGLLHFKIRRSAGKT